MLTHLKTENIYQKSNAFYQITIINKIDKKIFFCGYFDKTLSRCGKLLKLD